MRRPSGHEALATAFYIDQKGRWLPHDSSQGFGTSHVRGLPLAFGGGPDLAELEEIRFQTSTNDLA